MIIKDFYSDFALLRRYLVEVVFARFTALINLWNKEQRHTGYNVCRLSLFSTINFNKIKHIVNQAPPAEYPANTSLG
ncbi:hypothetical protein H0173_19575 [Bacillus sp. S/N-304-OC-R1]|nr:hypothetical protein [Bacillus sp. S/N-304-OC-R1]